MIKDQRRPVRAAFALKLFSALVEQQPARNVFVSPLSVIIALLILYEGARGETREELARTLASGDLNLLNEVRRSVRSLLGAHQLPGSGMQLVLANSLWLQEGIPIQPEFAVEAKEAYAVEVQNLDLASGAAVSRMNEWVCERTQGKIPGIVDSLGPPRWPIILNVVYFKGRWMEIFDKEMTHEGTFTLSDGSQKKLPMMTREGYFDYFPGPDFQALSIPYADPRFRMYIVLPDRAWSELWRGHFWRDQFSAKWESWMGNFQPRAGYVEVPRFKVEYTAGLKPALTELGLGCIFDPSHADFTGICRSPANLWVGDVIHKALLEVDELGTEAAATTVEMMEGAAQSAKFEPPFRMIVDHPFLCVIRNNFTRTILFMGAIEDPE